MAQPGQSPNSDLSNADGSVDFSGGVDSNKVTTVQSQQNPNGLARNQLSWLINGTVRDGGITPRGGWKPVKKVGSGSSAYQGGFMYQPIGGSDPYLVMLIGGRPVKCLIDDSPVEDLFATAFQFSPNDKPSITIRPNTSAGFSPGDTLNVPADIQSIYGLPSSFVVPAAGQTKSFFTSSDVQGNVGDIILFYGSFTIQSASIVFDTTAKAWVLSMILLNNSYPSGKSITNAIPFGDPHGVPAFPGLTNQISGWQLTPFVTPAIGSTVAVTFTNPVDALLGNGTYLLYNGNSVTGVGVGNIFSYFQTYIFDSVNQQIVNTLHNVLMERSGISVGGKSVTSICGKSFDMGIGTNVPSGNIFQLDCTATDFVADAFTIQGLPQTITLRRNISAPAFGGNQASALAGTTLNFPMGTALVTNINRTTTYFFGDLVSKPFFCQGNEFLVIQAGDYRSLPLFWDGTILRKSIGITDTAVTPGTPGTNELPPGGPMDFYLGRFWYAQGLTASAGDITGGNSGTPNYQFRDAILNVTENPLVLGGDGFAVPANEGNITALSHNATQDAALGQGNLFMFTSKGAHALSVPITRTDWIAATSSNAPKIVPVQLAMGTNSDRSVVPVNGDLFYQDPLANIRTMLTAVRYFGQWGNIPVSSNIQRLVRFTDKSLLQWGGGIYFDNRMIQTALPLQTPQGTIHQALSVLDFESISAYGRDLIPTWEGMHEGLDILQMFTGIFSGEQRAFAIVVSRADFSLQLWELTKAERFDNTDGPIQMIAEFPALTWGNEFALKETIGAELWIDRLYGDCVFLLEYRPDGESCWQKWHEWKACTPRDSCENTSLDPCTGLSQVLCYPLTTFGESYRQTMTLPKPPRACSNGSGRPSNIAYQIQARLTVTGFCRIRGFILHASPYERQFYKDKVC